MGRANLALLLAGCLSGNDRSGRFEVSVDQSTEISTVASVRWTPEEELVEAWIEVGEGPDCSERYPAVRGDDGGWTSTLVGLAPGERHRVQVFADDGERIRSSHIEYVETDYPPSWLPELELGVRDESQAEGGFVITTLLAEPSSPVIIDEYGRYVWWYRPYEDSEKVVRARLSRAGNSVLYLEAPMVSAPLASGRALVEISIDGQRKHYRWVGAGLHHDFVELPDGVIGAIAYDTRQVSGEQVLGDRIVELHPDGREVEIWTVWDHLSPTEDGLRTATGDWIHANALDYDPSTETYTISLHNLDSIWRISRSGEVLWRLGGEHSDFEDESFGTDLFRNQHQFDVVDESIFVFDNGTVEEAASRVVEYALDSEEGSTGLAWFYEPEPEKFCYVLGDVDVLSNGNRQITWSTAGVIEELNDNDEVVWQVRSDLGGAFGYSSRVEALHD